MDELAPKKKFWYTPVGIEFDSSLTFEEWAAIGGGLLELHYMTPIRIGLWLCEGEARWGEMYAEGVSITHLSPDTLAHYKSTMSRIPTEVRQPGLTLSHYRTVAALPLEDQKKYLDEAHANNLSVRDLGALVGARALKIEPPCGGCGEVHPLQIFRLCETCADQISKKKNGE